jgi:hypothetical protein
VFVVADGAGSRPGTSALGAHLAVAAVLDAADPDAGFPAAFAAGPREAVTALVGTARDAVEAAAGELALEPGRLATTLCVAVAGEAEAVVAQIGDGIAALEGPDGAPVVVAAADRFEYANETVFLTTPGALDDHLKVHAAPVGKVSGLVLTTDGLRYKVLDDVVGGLAYPEFYVGTWAWARGADAASTAIADFLADVDDQTGDDKTLVVAVRGYEGEAGEPRRLSPRPDVTVPAEDAGPEV